MCSKKCWQPTKITIKSKARLSLGLQMQRWGKDYESQEGDVGVTVKWLKITSSSPGRREKLPLPVQVSSRLLLNSSIVPVRTRTSLDIGERALFLQLVLISGKKHAKQECPKLIPHSAHALWKGRSCSVEGNGLYSQRGVDCTWPLQSHAVRATFTSWVSIAWMQQRKVAGWMDVLNLVPVTKPKVPLLTSTICWGSLQSLKISFWVTWCLVCPQKAACSSCAWPAKSGLVLLDEKKLLLILRETLTKS